MLLEPNAFELNAETHAIAREVVRTQISALVTKLDDVSFDAETRIMEVKEELRMLQTELKIRDFSRIQNVAATAAERVGAAPSSASTESAKRALAPAYKSCLKAELKVLEDFVDPLDVAGSLLERYQIVPQNGVVPFFISISRAVKWPSAERPMKCATSST